jgi:hypothetical protein
MFNIRLKQESKIRKMLEINKFLSLHIFCCLTEMPFNFQI